MRRFFVRAEKPKISRKYQLLQDIKQALKKKRNLSVIIIPYVFVMWLPNLSFLVMLLILGAVRQVV